MVGKLVGKGILVTGGSRGIGAAIARRLARVIVNFHTSRRDAEEVVAEIGACGGWAQAAESDIADTQQMQALVNNAAMRLADAGGRLDILVNNAGIVEPAELEAIDEAHFDRQFATNVKSIVFGSQAAVEAITVALARELGPRGVRVNAVAPGTTLTDMTRRVLTAPLEAAAINRTALRRLGTPDDIAKVVAFLASDDAAWITGEVITASGGLR
jgi:3-oxoacyl-[acyl-carrier protein] reductase